MAGIYIHIPFCKQACSYCNFHFSTSMGQKDSFIDALCMEIEMRADKWSGEPMESIYLGGGTPSLLTAEELERIFKVLSNHFNLSTVKEITLEANPDDLFPDKLKALRDSPINRLSIGIQSYREEDLRYMNRAHNAKEARSAIELSIAQGFEKITIDLIYGTPGLSDQDWLENLRITADYDIPHISSYALTLEAKTALNHQVKKGTSPAPDEKQAARQLEILMDFAKEHGFEHYEISNFAKNQHYALHNTGYWFGKPYLGLGPSAHSYDGQNRMWNIANNAHYIQSIMKGTLPMEEEILSDTDRYNEWILTRLRTMWGLRLEDIPKSTRDFATHFLDEIQKWVSKDHVSAEEGGFKLTRSGKLLADHIASDLFFVD